MRKAFTIDNDTFVYDYGLCGIDEIQAARAILEYQNELIANPPRTYMELQRAGGEDWLQRAFSYLLRRKTPEGFEPNNPTVTRAFISRMSGSSANELQEKCLKDFFTKTRIRDLAQQRRTAHTIALARIMYSGQTQDTLTNAAELLNDKNESDDDTTPMKPSDV